MSESISIAKVPHGHTRNLYYSTARRCPKQGAVLHGSVSDDDGNIISFEGVGIVLTRFKQAHLPCPFITVVQAVAEETVNIPDVVIEEQVHHDPQRMSLDDQIGFYQNWAAELRTKRRDGYDPDYWLFTAGWQNMVNALIVYLKTAKALREIEGLRKPPNIRTDAEVWWCWFCNDWLTDEQVSAAGFMDKDEPGKRVMVHQHKCGHRVMHLTDLT